MNQREIKANDLKKTKAKFAEINSRIEACIKSRTMVTKNLLAQRDQCMTVLSLDDENSGHIQGSNTETFIEIPSCIRQRGYIYQREKEQYEQELAAIEVVIEGWINDVRSHSSPLVFVDEKRFGSQVMGSLRITDWVGLFDVKDLDVRRAQLKGVLETSQVISDNVLRVTENSTVTIVDLSNNKEITLSAFGQPSIKSIMGKQLIGCVKDDIVELNLPKGRTPVKVKEVK